MPYEFKGTPAPWRWEVNESHKSISLCGGKPIYDKTVMDFERWGMGGAAPSFRMHNGDDFEGVQRADKFTQEVPGREHHSSWFKTINQVDANVIAAAPQLLEACIKIVNWYDDNERNIYLIDGGEAIVEDMRKAVEVALNGNFDKTR